MREKRITMRIDECDVEKFKDYVKKNNLTQMKAFKELCNFIASEENYKDEEAYIKEIKGLKEQLEISNSQIAILKEELDNYRINSSEISRVREEAAEELKKSYNDSLASVEKKYQEKIDNNITTFQMILEMELSQKDKRIEDLEGELLRYIHDCI